jgi:hypothetical protein
VKRLCSTAAAIVHWAANSTPVLAGRRFSVVGCAISVWMNLYSFQQSEKLHNEKEVHVGYCQLAYIVLLYFIISRLLALKGIRLATPECVMGCRECKIAKPSNDL